jgi:hypothetical protein
VSRDSAARWESLRGQAFLRVTRGRDRRNPLRTPARGRSFDDFDAKAALSSVGPRRRWTGFAAWPAAQVGFTGILRGAELPIQRNAIAFHQLQSHLPRAIHPNAQTGFRWAVFRATMAESQLYAAVVVVPIVRLHVPFAQSDPRSDASGRSNSSQHVTYPSWHPSNCVVPMFPCS